MKLSHRLALLFAVFGALITGGFQYRQTTLLRREVNARVENMAGATLSAVRALVAAQALQGNFGELGRNLETLVRQAGVAAIVVFDSRGRRVVGRSDGPQSLQRSPHLGIAPENSVDGYYDVDAPVDLGGKGPGRVWLAFHTDKLESRLRQINNDGVRDGVMAFLAITMAAWLIGVSFAIDIERLLPSLEDLPKDPERFRPLKPISSVQELSRLVSAFNAMGQSLQGETLRRRELELEKRELSAMLVHDLKTPLTVIHSGISLLRDQLLEDPSAQRGAAAKNGRRGSQERTFELLTLSAGRLQRMVEDVLQLSRLEEVAGLRERVPVDLTELARSCAKDFELVAAERGQKIAFSAPAQPVKVSGDSALLRRVLDNFAYNAVEHNPAGGTVTIAVSEDDAGARASVSDTGPGIPPEARGDIFRKFFQSDVKRHVGNVGLGLALCEKVIERHGGTIGVEGAEPRGARFFFLLPRP